MPKSYLGVCELAQAKMVPRNILMISYIDGHASFSIEEAHFFTSIDTDHKSLG